MDNDKIIRQAKTINDEKGSLSVKLSLALKDSFVKVAKKNKIPINTLVVTMIDDFLNGESKKENNIKLVEKFSSLLDREKELIKIIDNCGSNIIEDKKGYVHNLGYELENIQFMIKKLKEVM